MTADGSPARKYATMFEESEATQSELCWMWEGNDA